MGAVGKRGGRSLRVVGQRGRTVGRGSRAVGGYRWTVGRASWAVGASRGVGQALRIGFGDESVAVMSGLTVTQDEQDIIASKTPLPFLFMNDPILLYFVFEFAFIIRWIMKDFAIYIKE